MTIRFGGVACGVGSSVTVSGKVCKVVANRTNYDVSVGSITYRFNPSNLSFTKV